MLDALPLQHGQHLPSPTWVCSPHHPQSWPQQRRHRGARHAPATQTRPHVQVRLSCTASEVSVPEDVTLQQSSSPYLLQTRSVAAGGGRKLRPDAAAVVQRGRDYSDEYVSGSGRETLPLHIWSGIRPRSSPGHPPQAQSSARSTAQAAAAALPSLSQADDGETGSMPGDTISPQLMANRGDAHLAAGESLGSSSDDVVSAPGLPPGQPMNQPPATELIFR